MRGARKLPAEERHPLRSRSRAVQALSSNRRPARRARRPAGLAGEVRAAPRPLPPPSPRPARCGALPAASGSPRASRERAEPSRFPPRFPLPASLAAPPLTAASRSRSFCSAPSARSSALRHRSSSRISSGSSRRFAWTRARARAMPDSKSTLDTLQDPPTGPPSRLVPAAVRELLLPQLPRLVLRGTEPLVQDAARVLRVAGGLALEPRLVLLPPQPVLEPHDLVSPLTVASLESQTGGKAGQERKGEGKEGSLLLPPLTATWRLSSTWPFSRSPCSSRDRSTSQRQTPPHATKATTRTTEGTRAPRTAAEHSKRMSTELEVRARSSGSSDTTSTADADTPAAALRRPARRSASHIRVEDTPSPRLSEHKHSGPWPLANQDSERFEQGSN